MRNGNYRDFPGRVALISLLRIGHVAGVVGVGAAVVFGRFPAGAFPFLLVACGVGIALLDAYANRAYFRQVNGLAVVLKAALLTLLVAFAAFGASAFWGFLIFSVAIAHAPGRIRHRKVL
jgi:hypothetical protein